MKTRKEALELLKSWTANPGLLKHALAVEACVRFYAKEFKQDEELWGNTGLLHDFDYEKYPDASDHPQKGMAELEKLGWVPELIHAIGAHATYLDIPRESLLDKALFAVDELSGFIVAVALSRANRSIAEVTVESVLKKMKTSAFARAINREDIQVGANELKVTLEKHIANCIQAMQGIAGDLGL